jgi:MATE family multidrug resistance protein
MWIANAVNLALDLLLVPGTFRPAGAGRVGGAWATTGARTFLASSCWPTSPCMPEARALGVFDKPERDRAAEAEQRRIGFGAGASNFFEVAAFASMNVIAGWIGGLAVAAWAIVLNVAAIVFMVPLGLATGAAVLVGRAYGARDRGREPRRGGRRSASPSRSACMVTLAGLADAAADRPGLHDQPADARHGRPGAGGLCLMYLRPTRCRWSPPRRCGRAATSGCPPGTHLTSYILLMMPLAWWLAIPMGMGIIGIAWAVVIASFVSGAFLLTRFWILSRRPL